MGMRDMDSVPPATITSAPPTAIRSAAMAMDCNPEEQKRLMVNAAVSTGSPARNAAMRATFMPCSASGMAQPRITSSISLGSSCGTRSSAPLIAIAASSSGRVVRSVPLKARPTGVRTDEMITASRIVSALATPILPGEIGDPRKFCNVGCHQGQLSLDRLSGNQHVIAADWLTSKFEGCTNRSRCAGVIFVKRYHCNGPTHKIIEAAGVERYARTLEYAVPHFEHCNRGNEDTTSRSQRTIKLPAHRIRTTIDKSYTHIRVE